MLPGKSHRDPTSELVVLRPALVEARLMTKKHVHDAIYVATLTEELQRIEAKIQSAEELLHLPAQSRPEHAKDAEESVDWFREKSAELDLRLRRIQQSAPA
jgi:hypothetical protein